MANAKASCASILSAPNDMAPVTKCFTMLSTGSTSSIGVGFAAFFHPKKSRMKIGFSFASTIFSHSWNFLYEPRRVAIWRFAIVSGFQAWRMPSLRYEN